MGFSYDVDDEEVVPAPAREKPFNYSAYPRINVRLVVLFLLTILACVLGLAILDAKTMLPFDVPFRIPKNLPQPVAALFASPTPTSTATPIPPTPTPTPTATPEPTAIARSSLGNLPGSISAGHSASAVLDPSTGTSNNIEVTDSAGYTWKLEIPPEALLTQVTLRLVALDRIDDTSALPLDSGIRVEPAGLVLLQPVRLTLKLPGDQASEDGVFLAASAPGAPLRLVETDRGMMDGEYQTWIWSFETVVWSGAAIDRLPLNYAPEALAEYRRAFAQVQALVDPLEPPAAPPESPPVCPPADPQAALASEQARWQTTSAYLRDILGEDILAVHRLIGARGALTHLGIGSGVEGLQAARELLERRALVSVAFLNQYYTPELPRAESGIAASLVLARLYQAAGGDPTQVLGSLHSGLIARLEKLTGSILEEHNYSFFPQSVINAGRWLSLADPGIESAVWEGMIINSLRFKVDVKYEIKGTLPDGKRIAYMIKGQIPVQPAFTGQQITWQSTGDLIYESGTFGSLKVLAESSFPVRIRVLGFDDCNHGQFHLAIDRLGAEQEDFLMGNQRLPGQGQAQLLSRSLLEPLGYYDFSSTQFIFPIEIIGNSPVFESQVKTQAGTLSASLSLRLVHEK